MIGQTGLDEVLIESAKEVFETMIFMDMQKCEDPENTLESENIMGLITFSGAIEGALAIRCQPVTAEVITANMLGLEPEDGVEHDDVVDTIGEISNMVLGSVKTRIQDSVGTINVSIPSVVHGRNIRNGVKDGVVLDAFKVLIEDKYNVEFSIAYRESKG